MSAVESALPHGLAQYLSCVSVEKAFADCFTDRLSEAAT
jgi:hypothetical protein